MYINLYVPQRTKSRITALINILCKFSKIIANTYREYITYSRHVASTFDI